MSSNNTPSEPVRSLGPTIEYIEDVGNVGDKTVAVNKRPEKVQSIFSFPADTYVGGRHLISDLDQLGQEIRRLKQECTDLRQQIDELNKKN